MKLCNLHDIPANGSIAVEGNQGPRGANVMLVRDGLTVKAYINSCPHTGAPLDWVDGHFLSNDQQHIQCRVHDALFEIESGRCVSGPCLGQCLLPVPIDVVNGEVWRLD